MSCPWLYKQNRPLNAPNPFTNLSLSREPYSPDGWPLVQHPTRTRRCSPRPTRALNQIWHPNSYLLRDAKVYGHRLRRSTGVRPSVGLSLCANHRHHYGHHHQCPSQSQRSTDESGTPCAKARAVNVTITTIITNYQLPTTQNSTVQRS